MTTQVSSNSFLRPYRCEWCSNLIPLLDKHTKKECAGRREWEKWLVEVENETEEMTQEDLDRLDWEEKQVFHWGQ